MVYFTQRRKETQRRKGGSNASGAPLRLCVSLRLCVKQFLDNQRHPFATLFDLELIDPTVM
jgi:hypothetical protein